MKDTKIVYWNMLITTYEEIGLLLRLAKLLQLENLDIGRMKRSNVISWSVVIGAFGPKERGEESLYFAHKL